MIEELGIELESLIREILTVHVHDFTADWGQPDHCMCGAWPELVIVLMDQDIQADRMSLDPFLRQSAHIKKVTGWG
jgi:hypothetical protein